MTNGKFKQPGMKFIHSNGGSWLPTIGSATQAGWSGEPTAVLYVHWRGMSWCPIKSPSNAFGIKNNEEKQCASKAQPPNNRQIMPSRNNKAACKMTNLQDEHSRNQCKIINIGHISLTNWSRTSHCDVFSGTSAHCYKSLTSRRKRKFILHRLLVETGFHVSPENRLAFSPWALRFPLDRFHQSPSPTFIPPFKLNIHLMSSEIIIQFQC